MRFLTDIYSFAIAFVYLQALPDTKIMVFIRDHQMEN